MGLTEVLTKIAEACKKEPIILIRFYNQLKVYIHERLVWCGREENARDLNDFANIYDMLEDTYMEEIKKIVEDKMNIETSAKSWSIAHGCYISVFELDEEGTPIITVRYGSVYGDEDTREWIFYPLETVLFDTKLQVKGKIGVRGGV